MVVVVFIDNIVITSKGSLEKHCPQVSKVCQFLMDKTMCLEIDKCIFDGKDVPCLGCVVSDSGLRMDPDEPKEIAVWPGHTTVKDIQQILGLWNWFR
jgi:hypothetical protein